MKQLEQFNAETTPLGTPLITRDGREVTEWHYFKTVKNSFSVVAVIEGCREVFTKEGRYFYTHNAPHRNDLFIKPKVKEAWVNVYMGKNRELLTGYSYNTKQQAIDNKKYVDYIKTIRITDEPE